MKKSARNSVGAVTAPAKHKRQSTQGIEEVILKAAEEAALNMDGKFTLVHVATVLEISPSTIYEHFRNKAALTAAVSMRLKK